MKILVVDDEKDIKVLFEQRFRKEIKNNLVEFMFAFSGEEAIEILETMGHEAVLILSDINMPGMSGLQLLENVKKKFLKPPPIVMMITAYGDAETERKAREGGAEGFLTKPIDFDALRDEIQLRTGTAA